MTPEQFERLPKYAQDHIKSLEREVERAHKEVKEVRSEINDPSDVMFLRSSYTREMIPLPARGRVIFKTPEGEIRVSWDEVLGGVQIMGEAERGGTFIVRPRVSNVVIAQFAEGL